MLYKGGGSVPAPSGPLNISIGLRGVSISCPGLLRVCKAGGGRPSRSLSPIRSVLKIPWVSSISLSTVILAEIAYHQSWLETVLGVDPSFHVLRKLLLYRRDASKRAVGSLPQWMQVQLVPTLFLRGTPSRIVIRWYGLRKWFRYRCWLVEFVEEWCRSEWQMVIVHECWQKGFNKPSGF